MKKNCSAEEKQKTIQLSVLKFCFIFSWPESFPLNNTPKRTNINSRYPQTKAARTLLLASFPSCMEKAGTLALALISLNLELNLEKSK